MSLQRVVYEFVGQAEKKCINELSFKAVASDRSLDYRSSVMELDLILRSSNQMN